MKGYRNRPEATAAAIDQLPLRLHIVPALPRNPAGKVLQFVLKDDLQK